MYGFVSEINFRDMNSGPWPNTDLDQLRDDYVQQRKSWPMMYAEAQRTYLGNIVVYSVVILFSPLTFVFVRSVRSLLLRRHDLRKGSSHTWTVRA